MRAEPNEPKAGESFVEKQILWFQTVARCGRVVANLCVEGKLDLESGIDMILKCHAIIVSLQDRANQRRT